MQRPVLCPQISGALISAISYAPEHIGHLAMITTVVSVQPKAGRQYAVILPTVGCLL